METPRETLVIELNCNSAIGSDKNGEKKVSKYIEDQAKILNRSALIEPATHLSERYGLSGWAPLRDGAIHVYAWDHKNQPQPPFVSVDISTPAPIPPDVREEIMKSTLDQLDGRKPEIVYKTSSDAVSPEWRELAPHIIRQRLSILGKLDDDISDKEVSKYMEELSLRLGMKQLSNPLTYKDKAWMHWETSGSIALWDNRAKNMDVEIYTCKAFSPEDAIDFTRNKLKLTPLSLKNF